MIEPSKPNVTRAAGWELLTECVKHPASFDLERREYFQTLTASTNPEDFHLRLAALTVLTRNGRLLSGFHYDVLPLLHAWLQEAYNEARLARRRTSRVSRALGQAQSKSSSSSVEKNLSQLFAFIKEVIKNSFSIARPDEQSLCGMIDSLLSICMSTAVQDDLQACISVLNAITTSGSIPAQQLENCVHVLSSICCLVPSLQSDAWTVLSILFRSRSGESTVRILLDTLRTGPVEGGDKMDMTRKIRGALCVFHKLLSEGIEKWYPTVPFTLLIDGLSTTAKRTHSVKTLYDVLELVSLLFDNGNIHRIATGEDWTVLLEVVSAIIHNPTFNTDSPSPSPPANNVWQRLDEAEVMFALALEGYERRWGPYHPSTLDAVRKLGLLYKSRGKLGEAEKMFERLSKGKEKDIGRSELGSQPESFDRASFTNPSYAESVFSKPASDEFWLSKVSWENMNSAKDEGEYEFCKRRDRRVLSMRYRSKAALHCRDRRSKYRRR